LCIIISWERRLDEVFSLLSLYTLSPTCRNVHMVSTGGKITTGLGMPVVVQSKCKVSTRFRWCAGVAVIGFRLGFGTVNVIQRLSNRLPTSCMHETATKVHRHSSESSHGGWSHHWTDAKQMCSCACLWLPPRQLEIGGDVAKVSLQVSCTIFTHPKRRICHFGRPNEHSRVSFRRTFQRV
jgi:hypothetical protein